MKLAFSAVLLAAVVFRSGCAKAQGQPQVAEEVNPAKIRVTVMGTVYHPESYDLAPGSTVQQAIKAAGGLLPRWDKRVVVRRGTTIFTMILFDDYQAGRGTNQFPLKNIDKFVLLSGDCVCAPES